MSIGQCQHPHLVFVTFVQKLREYERARASCESLALHSRVTRHVHAPLHKVTADRHCMSLSVCVSVFVCVCLSLCIYLSLSLCVFVCVCLFLHHQMNGHYCMYMYMYIIHVPHIHIYIVVWTN